MAPASPAPRRSPPERGTRAFFLAGASSPLWPGHFCGYLRHRQAAHLQGATKRQADHGEGTDQHADRNQLAIALAHIWQLTTEGPPHRTTSPQVQRRTLLYTRSGGYKRAVRRPRTRVISGSARGSGSGWQRALMGILNGSVIIRLATRETLLFCCLVLLNGKHTFVAPAGRLFLRLRLTRPVRPGLRIARDFLPEFFALLVGDHYKRPKARLVFVKQRRPWPAQARAVACQDGGGRPPLADAQVRREARACGEPHKIEGVRHIGRFIKIIHAPDETALRIAPCTEILGMDVADAQHAGGIFELRTDRFDALSPAEVGRAKENKGAFPHPFVLERKVGLDHLAAAAQPVLKCLVFFFE